MTCSKLVTKVEVDGLVGEPSQFQFPSNPSNPIREWTTVAGDAAATPVRPKTVAAKKEGLSISSQKEGMILRMWKGCSVAGRAGAYVQHATKKVFPALAAIEGHRGAYLLHRTVDGVIEFLVLTLWDSMAAVRRFAGTDPDKAVVEPEARAILKSFDESVSHFEIVHAVETSPEQ